jgi:hypothetical protein
MTSMPPLQPVPNVLKTQLLWDVGTDENVTTTNFWSYSGTQPNATAVSNFCTVLCNLMSAQDALWTGSVVLVGATGVDLASDTASEGSATADTPGIDTGAQLAGGTCVLLNYKIDRRYRGGKPRNYFPWGSSTTLSTRQSWSPGFVANCASGWSQVTSGFIGQTESGCTITNHANVSYYSGSNPNPNPNSKYRTKPAPRPVPLVNAITSFSVSNIPGSQRRRNR